jgi:hypothetical protein
VGFRDVYGGNEPAVITGTEPHDPGHIIRGHEAPRWRCNGLLLLMNLPEDVEGMRRRQRRAPIPSVVSPRDLTSRATWVGAAPSPLCRPGAASLIALGLDDQAVTRPRHLRSRDDVRMQWPRRHVRR